jgi:lipopolysaccharide export system permease protein
MSRLSRYILREHSAPFLFSLALIVFLFVLNFAFQILGKILGKGLSAQVILEFFFYNIAWILAMAVPMAALIATLMAFGRMTSDHEITALKASGVSLTTLVRPVVLVAILIAMGLSAYNNWVLPDFNHKSSLLRRSIFRKSPTLQMEESLFLFDVPNMVLHSKSINHASRRMYGVTIFDERERGVHTTILADSADLNFSEQSLAFHLDLHAGQIHRREWKSAKAYSLIRFQESRLSIPAKNMMLRRQESKYRGDREQTAAQMLSRIRKWEERDPERNARKIRSYWVEIHKKFSIPVAVIIFVLIGAPLGVKSGSGGMGMAGSLSVLFFLGYWIFLIGGEDLADRGFLAPWVAMWAPNLLLGMLGLWLLRGATREGKPFAILDRLRLLGKSKELQLEPEEEQVAMKALADEIHAKENAK